MVLTVRQRGQILLPDGESLDDITAAIWFDGDEETGPWGGIVEPGVAASLLRAQVIAGEIHYLLVLEDGRQGTITLRMSEFEADGAHPLAFTGVGSLSREASHG